MSGLSASCLTNCSPPSGRLSGSRSWSPVCRVRCPCQPCCRSGVEEQEVGEERIMAKKPIELTTSGQLVGCSSGSASVYSPSDVWLER